MAWGVPWKAAHVRIGVGSDSPAPNGLWPLRHPEEGASEPLTSTANEESSVFVKTISAPFVSVNAAKSRVADAL
jgi:hypothetical protein